MDPEAFITRWTAREGGAERANYQGFLYDVCELIGVARPDVSGAEVARNDYVFERAVRPRESDGGHAPKRIDLYKRGCFILEAKQSRLPGRKNALPEQFSIPTLDPPALGRRSVARGWDVMMLNARRQAEAYVFLLDPDHAAPPFLIVCDVGHCFEIYADFSGTGRAYQPFPDRQGFRVYLEDLRREDVRARLAAIWTDPRALDPAMKAARVTREIAGRLAAVSKALEAAHPGEAEAIAHFLMRCIFTMFAEDVDLLPKGRFTKLLEDCVSAPHSFAPLLDEIWSRMDESDADRRFSSALRAPVRHFNGNLFKGARAYRLGREEIGELVEAAKKDWREVDPAIFGALLEQALDKAERKRLGAHYTPRAYVERLVDATVMEPLRADWQAALTRAEAAKDAGDDRRAVVIIRAFLKKLCGTRVLDPACGTGNFLYVALERMKALEGEALETLARLGEPESMGLDRETVDPHQFLGLELNPRAAAIAELVVWIGYLQQHYRTRTGHPGEPILRAFRNVNFGTGRGYDAVLTWDGYPLPTVVERDGRLVEAYPNARRPDWPEAEFIVGNPPFIGNKRMREQLGDGYVEALRFAYDIPESVDFVMFWWRRSAELLAARDSRLRRFGLVTTNSITQTFNRRVIETSLNGERRASLIMAIADHPWTKASSTSAAVRIAMTVLAPGTAAGILFTVVNEQKLDTDVPTVELETHSGMISSDLTIGAATSSAVDLLANFDLAHQGVTPLGEGFRLSANDLAALGYHAPLPNVIRPYLIGRDLVGRPEKRFIIDFFGLSSAEARRLHPKLFEVVLERVKPERAQKKRAAYREKFWIYAEPRSRMRTTLAGSPRYIATCRTARHRIFSFVPGDVLPDAKIVAIAACDADLLAVLSSRPHTVWAVKTGARLGVGNDFNYNHSDCFGRFPFPGPSPALRENLRAAGEELDALRKRVQADNPDITLTGLYNVLEKVRAGAALSDKEDDVRRRGFVLILKELHEAIDRLTLAAYGWPQELSDEDVLGRLVALNAERAREEAAGRVRWLRPDFQAARFGGTAAKSGALALEAAVAPRGAAALPAFPTDRYEQPLAVEAALAGAGRPLDADALAQAFRGVSKARTPRVAQVLGTLARYGRVTALPDGRYAARRAA